MYAGVVFHSSNYRKLGYNKQHHKKMANEKNSWTTESGVIVPLAIIGVWCIFILMKLQQYYLQRRFMASWRVQLEQQARMRSLHRHACIGLVMELLSWAKITQKTGLIISDIMIMAAVLQVAELQKHRPELLTLSPDWREALRILGGEIEAKTSLESAILEAKCHLNSYSVVPEELIVIESQRLRRTTILLGYQILASSWRGEGRERDLLNSTLAIVEREREALLKYGIDLDVVDRELLEIENMLLEPRIETCHLCAAGATPVQ
jgi:hypothetical protein